MMRVMCVTTGRVFEVVSVLLFVVMLLLMGKGYTITRGRISTSGAIKIAIFMTLYALTYVVLFFYQAHVRTDFFTLRGTRITWFGYRWFSGYGAGLRSTCHRHVSFICAATIMWIRS